MCFKAYACFCSTCNHTQIIQSGLRCATVNAGMDCPQVRYPQLNDVVEADLAEQGYQVLTDPGQQVDKVIQLYEVRPHILAVENGLSASASASACQAHGTGFRAKLCF